MENSKYREDFYFRITFVTGKELSYSNNCYYIKDYKNDKCLEVRRRASEEEVLFIPNKENILCIEYNVLDD